MGIFNTMAGAIALGGVLFSGTAVAADTYDFGDNPDSYRTTLAADGARHLNATQEWLGPGIGAPGYVATDYEIDGQPALGYGTAALGDDQNGADDENGVQFLGSFDSNGDFVSSIYMAGLTGQVRVSVSVADHTSARYVGAGNQLYLDAWLDWAHDGDFDDTGVLNGQAWTEHVIAQVLDPSTWSADTLDLTLSFFNGNGPTGPFYGRFRLSYGEGSNDWFGLMTYGEVEDYGGCTAGGLCHGQEGVDAPSAAWLLVIGGWLLAVRRRSVC